MRLRNLFQRADPVFSHSDGGTPDIETLFIKELIRRVHEELLDSQDEREALGSAPIFEVSGMTLEVNFIATRSTEARGGLDFKVVTVGGLGASGSRAYERSQVHKITLVLEGVAYEGHADAELRSSRFLPRDDDD